MDYYAGNITHSLRHSHIVSSPFTRGVHQHIYAPSPVIHHECRPCVGIFLGRLVPWNIRMAYALVQRADLHHLFIHIDISSLFLAEFDAFKCHGCIDILIGQFTDVLPVRHDRIAFRDHGHGLRRHSLDGITLRIIFFQQSASVKGYVHFRASFQPVAIYGPEFQPESESPFIILHIKSLQGGTDIDYAVAYILPCLHIGAPVIAYDYSLKHPGQGNLLSGDPESTDVLERPAIGDKCHTQQKNHHGCCSISHSQNIH